jgi:acyl-CoA reductase-like NAD-dependent aldehyde dehydrogenase
MELSILAGYAICGANINSGNIAILKHSSVCIGSSLNIRDALTDAGFPENVFQIVIGNYRAGEALVQSKIDAV